MSSGFQVLSSVQAIQQKLSLYLGSSDSEAVLRAVFEVTDNCLDEYNEGRNNSLGVIIDSDKTITVYDEGGGIPVTKHEVTGKPIIQEAFTSLHAGGKFKEGLYKQGTRGTHGIGSKATNALSSEFEVWTYRNNKWWYISFKNGLLDKPLTSKVVHPLTIKKGTIIKFKINLSFFDKGSTLSLSKLKAYLKLQSYICKGLKIYLKTPKNEYNFFEKEGIKTLLENQVLELGEESEELGPPFLLQRGSVDVALSWTKNSGEISSSYVSGSNTKEGGSHLTGLYDAIRDALKPYKENKEFIPAEARDGLVSVLNLSLTQPRFSSQAKERLSDDRATALVYDIVKPELDDFFAKNKSLVKTIVTKADLLHKRTEKFKTDKKDIAQLKSPEAKMLLASKLRGCRTKDISKRELFIVEGDSAGGTAKQGSDKEYQMILPLRGKILNAYKKEKLLFKNSEVLDIFRSIGILDPNIEDPVKALKTNKIILLMDPDVDGKHITNLALSLFQKIVPETVIQNHIFLVDAPLFNSQLSNGKKIYGGSVAEVEAQFKKLGKKIPPEGVQRIKGWGEVSATTLKEIAFNPLTRKLTRVTAPKTKEEEQEFASVVGEDAGERRKLLKV